MMPNVDTNGIRWIMRGGYFFLQLRFANFWHSVESVTFDFFIQFYTWGVLFPKSAMPKKLTRVLTIDWWTEWMITYDTCHPHFSIVICRMSRGKIEKYVWKSLRPPHLGGGGLGWTPPPPPPPARTTPLGPIFQKLEYIAANFENLIFLGALRQQWRSSSVLLVLSTLNYLENPLVLIFSPGKSDLLCPLLSNFFVRKISQPWDLHLFLFNKLHFSKRIFFFMMKRLAG